MIIYKDIFTEQDMFSDSFKTELIDDVIFKVEAKEMSVDNSVDDSVFGGNKSAEAEAEEMTDDKVTEIDVVSANKLEVIPSIESKKDFKDALRTYMKKLVAKLAETDPVRAKAIQDPINKFVAGTLLHNFKKINAFYAGEGDAYDVEGSMAILMSTDDAKKFHIYYFKDGLFKEKC